MIEFEQKITSVEYTKAVAIHYFGYKYTLINPVLGFTILILLGIVSVTTPEMINTTFFILLVLAVYLLLRPLIYIQGAYQATKSNEAFFELTQITITDDEKMIARANGDESSVYLKSMYAYSDTKDFIFLYYSRVQYFLLNKRYMKSNQIEEVVSKIERLGIKAR